jgi:pimeloyl-ACP methyl ester carboxylesterase
MLYIVTPLRNEKERTQMTLIETSYAGLSATERAGTDPDAPAFVLLHGLTFDRRMWRPILELLPESRRAIAFDLPAHGGSVPVAEPGLAPVAEAVHAAVEAAGIADPIVVGHSIGGPIAGIYAAAHPAAGVVSVDAPIRFEPLAAMLRSMAVQLAGPGFDGVWSRLRDTWGMDRVPEGHRELLRAADTASREVVLRYQADIMERTLEEVVRWRDEGMAAVAAAGIPYISLLANPVEPADEAWLVERVPGAQVVVWPVGHHFPHLARPGLFAQLLAEVAGRVPAAV